jgi:hypothetical protein
MRSVSVAMRSPLRSPHTPARGEGNSPRPKKQPLIPQIRYKRRRRIHNPIPFHLLSMN